jgi:putative Mg2+ transporter-C (MgtC) family protein
VIQGIGFIGAASVLKQGGYVVGVNTAASILVAASIGCFIGSGYALYGLLLAPLAMSLNVVLKMLEQWIEKGHNHDRVIGQVKK